MHRIPAPEKLPDQTLRALFYLFDAYRGVVGYVRVVSGKMESDQAINEEETRDETRKSASLRRRISTSAIKRGRRGHFIANIQEHARVKDRRYRDRSAQSSARAAARLPGNSSDGVSGIYRSRPATSNISILRSENCNDSAFIINREVPWRLVSDFAALLGLSRGDHPGTTPARIDMDIIATSPSVVYEVVSTPVIMLIDNPATCRIRRSKKSGSKFEGVRLVERKISANILQLMLEKRGLRDHTESLDTRRVMLHCECRSTKSWSISTTRSKYGKAKARWITTCGISRGEVSEARSACERRSGRCLLDDCASRSG